MVLCVNIALQKQFYDPFFSGFYNRKGFIISQHPLESTVSALWQLVAEQDVQVRQYNCHPILLMKIQLYSYLCACYDLPSLLFI